MADATAVVCYTFVREETFDCTRSCFTTCLLVLEEPRFLFLLVIKEGFYPSSSSRKYKSLESFQKFHEYSIIRYLRMLVDMVDPRLLPLGFLEKKNFQPNYQHEGSKSTTSRSGFF